MGSLHPLQVFRDDEHGPAHLPFNLGLRVTGEPLEVGIGEQNGRVLGDEDRGVARVLEDGAVALLAPLQEHFGLFPCGHITDKDMESPRVSPVVLHEAGGHLVGSHGAVPGHDLVIHEPFGTAGFVDAMEHLVHAACRGGAGIFPVALAENLLGLVSQQGTGNPVEGYDVSFQIELVVPFLDILQDPPVLLVFLVHRVPELQDLFLEFPYPSGEVLFRGTSAHLSSRYERDTRTRSHRARPCPMYSIGISVNIFKYRAGPSEAPGPSVSQECIPWHRVTPVMHGAPSLTFAYPRGGCPVPNHAASAWKRHRRGSRPWSRSPASSGPG